MLKSKKPSISFFCPAYNDEENLPILIPKTVSLLREVADKFEVVIIEDGSPDNTDQVADNLAKKFKEVRVIHHKTNKGYGAALLSGFKHANKYPYIFYTDGDNQYDVDVLKEMLKYIDAHDVVIGRRINRALKLRRKIQTYVYNWMIRTLFNLNNSDINCAIKLFKRSSFKKIKTTATSAFFPAEVLLELHRTGAKIKEVDVRHYPRLYGKESGGKISVISGTFIDLIKYYVRNYPSLRQG